MPFFWWFQIWITTNRTYCIIEKTNFWVNPDVRWSKLKKNPLFGGFYINVQKLLFKVSVKCDHCLSLVMNLFRPNILEMGWNNPATPSYAKLVVRRFEDLIWNGRPYSRFHKKAPLPRMEVFSTQTKKQCSDKKGRSDERQMDWRLLRPAKELYHSLPSSESFSEKKRWITWLELEEWRLVICAPRSPWAF